MALEVVGYVRVAEVLGPALRCRFEGLVDDRGIGSQVDEQSDHGEIVA